MILQKIRERTLDYHDDFTSWANPILTGKINKKEFQNVLKVFYGFYYPLEEKIYNLDSLNQLGLKINQRKKIVYLLRDMNNFEIDENEIKDIELCNDYPIFDSIEKILGILYVIEGATLGGQIIANKLQEIFNKEIHFFNSYGENVRKMWKEYCDILNEYGNKNPEKQEEIVKSSENTYYKFNNWLQKIPR
jgi:heme oxygenase